MKQNFNFVNTFFGDMMKNIKKIIFFLLSITLSTCIIYLVCYMIPSPKLYQSNQITIYDNNNKIVMQTQYENEGKYLEIDDINEDFIASFICSEDENFYYHLGFSVKGTLRAFINNIKNKTLQGGSTITQQLSRSIFLDNEKKISRKLKEAFITIRIETHYDKKEIIEQYLNNIYLGHNIYGIEQASLYYFNKTNTKLSLDEVALISGIANAPNINAPDINFWLFAQGIIRPPHYRPIIFQSGIAYLVEHAIKNFGGINIF